MDKARLPENTSSSSPGPDPRHQYKRPRTVPYEIENASPANSILPLEHTRPPLRFHSSDRLPTDEYGSNAQPGSSSNSVPSTLHGLQGAVNSLKEQNAEILSMMRRITDRQDQAAVSAARHTVQAPVLGSRRPQLVNGNARSGPSSRPQTPTYPEDTVMYGEAPRRQPLAQIIKVFELPSPGHVYDPIESGLADGRTMALAWQIFTQTFVKTLPLLRCYPQSSSDSGLPSHPLMRLAILYYVASLGHVSGGLFDMEQRALISDTLEATLSRWHLMRPDAPIVEALLVISSAPAGSWPSVREDLAAMRAFDPFGAGAISHLLAKQINLEEVVKIVPREVGGESRSICETWPALNKLCLWFSIDHRQRWRVGYMRCGVIRPLRLTSCLRSDFRSDILSASSSSPPSSSLDDMVTPLSFRRHQNVWYQHLLIESRLLQLAQPLRWRWDAIVSARTWDTGSMQEINDHFDALHTELTSWRDGLADFTLPSSSYLQLLSYILPVALATKINLDLEDLLRPPIHFDVAFKHIGHYATLFARETTNMVRYLGATQPDLSRVPAFCLSVSLLAGMTIAQMSLGPQAPPKLREDYESLQNCMTHVSAGARSLYQHSIKPFGSPQVWRDAFASLKQPQSRHVNGTAHVNGTEYGDQGTNAGIFGDMALMFDLDWPTLMAEYGLDGGDVLPVDNGVQPA